MFGNKRMRANGTPSACLQILVTYGRYPTSVNNAADVYTQKFKGISICMLILTRTLVGYYVNFGVFELYGDPALKVGSSSPRLYVSEMSVDLLSDASCLVLWLSAESLLEHPPHCEIRKYRQSTSKASLTVLQELIGQPTDATSDGL